MGKIRIVGKAEREYQPDLCDLNIHFESEKRTSDAASKYVNDQCEKFLSDLIEKGFTPDNFVIVSDGVNLQTDLFSRRDDTRKEKMYHAFRKLRLTIPAEQNIINTIRDIAENGYKSVSFSSNFKISNESEIKRKLIQDAVADSKAQAVLLAEAMTQKIVGIDTANLSGSGDYFISEELEKRDLDTPTFLRLGSSRPLSDKLKAEKIKLSAEVNIVWILDSK